MIILGIESSCDETAAAVLQKQGNRVTILSNVVTSSAELQSKYGGVIPEQAAREQIKSIIPVIEEALSEAKITQSNLDAIAVTYGPGLIGSLLVGVETAKTLATIWNKPLIPINHLLGHFYANWISPSSLRAPTKQSSSGNHLNKIASSITPRNDVLNVPTFPCIGLLVSGGHTDLLLFKDHGKYEYLGGTRDDAAGECFDKCARLLGLPYPGGPVIAQLAKSGNPEAYNLPRPMIDSKDFDFSFSGLKTAVSNLLKVTEKPNIHSFSAAIQQAIVDVLITKTIQAVQKYRTKDLIIAGGVAANEKLKNDLEFRIENLKLKINLHIPSTNLCTDNAAMVAAAAYYQKPAIKPLRIQANPNLSL